MEDFSTGKRDIGKGVAKNLGEQNKFYFKLIIYFFFLEIKNWSRVSHRLIHFSLIYSISRTFNLNKILVQNFPTFHYDPFRFLFWKNKHFKKRKKNIKKLDQFQIFESNT